MVYNISSYESLTTMEGDIITYLPLSSYTTKFWYIVYH